MKCPGVLQGHCLWTRISPAPLWPDTARFIVWFVAEQHFLIRLIMLIRHLLLFRPDFCTVLLMRTVIYPGSFDPLTNGHLDLIQRATKLFDRVIVAVARSEGKNPLFTQDERVQMVARAVRGLPHVEAETFDGLLIEYVERRSAQAVIRGLRAVSDFEFEFQLALMNRKLNERIETIFMMPKDTYTFLSSRIVKEIARLGGDVSGFVPSPVREALVARLTGTAA